MHLSLLLIVLGLSWVMRLYRAKQTPDWIDRWQKALGQFLLPPLLLLTTALAVLLMGTQGTMLKIPVGCVGYLVASAFLSFAAALLLWLSWRAWRSLQKVRTHAAVDLGDRVGHVLETSALFAAQIGFWQPSLVVSQGLLNTLDRHQLEAVLTHEQAHFYYRDTFWFFWLGWVRQLTAWLPNTEALWQELLLLRELRADRWAAQQVDSLVLAETLLLVVQSPLADPKISTEVLSALASPFRLQERIEALITEPSPIGKAGLLSWTWLLLAVFPLFTVIFHA